MAVLTCSSCPALASSTTSYVPRHHRSRTHTTPATPTRTTATASQRQRHLRAAAKQHRGTQSRRTGACLDIRASGSSNSSSSSESTKSTLTRESQWITRLLLGKPDQTRVSCTFTLRFVQVACTQTRLPCVLASSLAVGTTAKYSPTYTSRATRWAAHL